MSDFEDQSHKLPWYQEIMLRHACDQCKCIQNWKKKNTMLVQNGKVVRIVELLNFSGEK